MRRLLVLGAGTAGTMVVNKLRHRLDKAERQITAVDESDRHFYQPGYLFIPFGGYTPRRGGRAAAAVHPGRGGPGLRRGRPGRPGRQRSAADRRWPPALRRPG